MKLKSGAWAILAAFALTTVVLTVVACGQPAPRSDQASGPVVLPDGTVATSTALPRIAPPDEVPEGLESVWEAYGYLVREYVEREKVDPEKLAEGAIKGMVDALADRHTAYIDPDAYKTTQSDFQGKFEGIGASVEQAKDGRYILIVGPLPGSPAEAAGIKAGDKIIAVDGVDAEGWSVVEAVNKIRGPGGTAVELTIERLGESQARKVVIVRGTIEQPSVTSRMLEDAPFGVVKINQFTAETHSEMREAFDSVIKGGAKGVVIDLRQNPGGLLTTVSDIVSEFVAKGLVTYEVDGRGIRTDWPIKPGAHYPELPLVVLVDAYSASGSEVLAGALQDHGRAVVIGTQTFGKGSVNFLRDLSNGGGLYLTVARWYTPNGRLLEELGVTPDLVVEQGTASVLNADFEDTQMSAAITQLNYQLGVASAQ